MNAAQVPKMSSKTFNPACSLLEDPFACPDDAHSTFSAPARTHSNVSAYSTPTRVLHSLSITPNSSLSRSAKSAPLISPTLHRGRRIGFNPGPQTKTVQETPEHARAENLLSSCKDRQGCEITDENAQDFYGPGHAVFLGNLPKSMANDTLQILIKEELESRIGKCFVSIARDTRGIPTAFVIFARTDYALKALDIGSGLIIGRRTLRAEAPKGNFILVAFKIDGSEVTHREISDLFEDSKPLHRCFTPDDATSEVFDLPRNAKCIQFATFGDFRDARKALHQPLNGLNVLPLSKLGVMKPPGWSLMPSDPRVLDASSIFVGNLPFSCTEHDLLQMFSIYGVVKSVDIMRPGRTVAHHDQRVYAFIIFSDPRAVFEAVAGCRDQKYHGQSLRVEFRPHMRAAIQLLEREARGYIAQCYSQLGHGPPFNMVLNHLMSKAAEPVNGKVQMLDGVPCTPAVAWIGNLLQAQGQLV